MKIILALCVSGGLFAQGSLSRVTLIPDPFTGAPGELLFREDKANGTDYLRLRAAAALASPFTLTFPAALPAAPSLLNSTAAGAMGWTSLSGLVDTTSVQTILPGAIKTFQERTDWTSGAGALRVRANQAGSAGLLTIHSGAAGSETNPVRLAGNGIDLNNGAALRLHDSLSNETFRAEDSGALASLNLYNFTGGALRHRLQVIAGAGGGSITTYQELFGTTTATTYMGLGSIAAQYMSFSDRIVGPSFTRAFKVPTSGDSLHSYIWPTLLGADGDCFKRGPGSPGFDVQTYWGTCGGAAGNYITLDTDQISSPNWITGDKTADNAVWTWQSNFFGLANRTMIQGSGVDIQNGFGSSRLLLAAVGDSPQLRMRNAASSDIWTWDNAGGLRHFDSFTGLLRMAVNTGAFQFGIMNAGGGFIGRGWQMTAGGIFTGFDGAGTARSTYSMPAGAGTAARWTLIDTAGTSWTSVDGPSVCGTVTVVFGFVVGCSP